MNSAVFASYVDVIRSIVLCVYIHYWLFSKSIYPLRLRAMDATTEVKDNATVKREKLVYDCISWQYHRRESALLLLTWLSVEEVATWRSYSQRWDLCALDCLMSIAKHKRRKTQYQRNHWEKVAYIRKWRECFPWYAYVLLLFGGRQWAVVQWRCLCSICTSSAHFVTLLRVG